MLRPFISIDLTCDRVTATQSPLPAGAQGAQLVKLGVSGSGSPLRLEARTEQRIVVLVYSYIIALTVSIQVGFRNLIGLMIESSSFLYRGV